MKCIRYETKGRARTEINLLTSVDRRCTVYRIQRERGEREGKEERESFDQDLMRVLYSKKETG